MVLVVMVLLPLLLLLLPLKGGASFGFQLLRECI